MQSKHLVIISITGLIMNFIPGGKLLILKHPLTSVRNSAKVMNGGTEFVPKFWFSEDVF